MQIHKIKTSKQLLEIETPGLGKLIKVQSGMFLLDTYSAVLEYSITILHDYKQETTSFRDVFFWQMNQPFTRLSS